MLHPQPFPTQKMATLHTLQLTTLPSFKTLTAPITKKLANIQLNNPGLEPRLSRRLPTSIKAFKVLIEHGVKTTELEVEPDETILCKALESGLEVPYDCNLGVCMTCPARLLDGKVDQSDGMLSDDVIERGYALMCAAYPRSDCHIRIIPEEELLSLQLATADD